MEKKLKKVLLEKTKRANVSHRFEVIEQKAKPIISLWLISQDIDRMIECIERAIKVENIKNIDELIVESLWEKMIIGYGKIFSNSVDGFSKIEPTHYFKSKRSLAIHKELIKVRNSYLAHRGYNEYEHCLMVLDVVDYNGSQQIEFTFPSLKQVGYFTNNRRSIVVHLKALNKKVKLQTSKKIRNLRRFLLTEHTGN